MRRTPFPLSALPGLGRVAVLLAMLPAAAAGPVEVHEREIVLPTYLAGSPEPNPMFFFGQASQGAEGRIYPYPLYDTLTHRKEDRPYTLVTLENEYVRVGILPEIGGRLFEALDKTNGYHFVYRQHVIKPALIGLIGAWISGGIEWNIPHHHRASTFLPVQYRIEEGPDGSRTVWVGELEVRHRMRWAVGYTLRPGCSVLEARVRILNRTPLAQSMLCFANVAVHVNEDYQVIFPPRTRYVTFHGKGEFTTWPIATGRYAGTDYGASTDVSWFKNHVNATSMFAWNYEDDFFAGYDHGQDAGTMCVADHRVVPGKKLWTWGNGPRGRMWDRILTDEDGPYIELMVGAYSDNQPDYSWLQPYEVRAFSMHWYPFRGIGGVTNANLDAAVNLDVADDGTARLGVCTTAAHPEATVRLAAGEEVLFEKTIAIDPGHPFVTEVQLPAGLDPNDLRAALVAGGRELIADTPTPPDDTPEPEPVRPPAPPEEMKTVEELYLAGLRIEQFHNPRLDPEPYWEEALRRDPGDARTNTAVGLRLLKQARHAEAEAHFRTALDRLTAGYTTPKDTEPFYYLGVALEAQGRHDEATEAFARATWGFAWRAAGAYALAENATRRGDLAGALDDLGHALEFNARNIRALTLRAAVLRHLGRADEALAVLDAASDLADPLDVRAMAERWLATRATEDERRLVETMRAHPATALETAAEYRAAGLDRDGFAVLALLDKSRPEETDLPALVLYELGDLAERLGRGDEAAAYRRRAESAPPDVLFPFQREQIGVLRRAMAANPQDARALYHLGNLLYDRQPDEAVRLWEQAAALDPSFPIVHRNLALAYSRRPRGNDLERAIAELEQATAVPDPYPLHFAELDELYEAAGTPPERRLERLEAHQDVVARRDDALAREIALLVALGRYDDAIGLLTGRQFAVWEGGTLRVADDWTTAHLLRGRQRLAAGQAREAIADFQAAATVPENLPSEQFGEGTRAAEIAYWTGAVRVALGDREGAAQAWQQAAEADSPGGRRGGGRGLSERTPARYFQALALRELGRDDEARAIFRDLVEVAERVLSSDDVPTDPAAPARVQAAQRARRARAHYVAALGHLGLGESDAARRELAAALQARPDHAEARAALAELGGPEPEDRPPAPATDPASF